MNKDAILATIIGFGIGLVITGLVITGPTLIKSFPSVHLTNPTSKQPTKPSALDETPKPNNNITNSTLTIQNPQPETIATKNSISVYGTSTPNNPVVIAGENTETVITADASGKFTGNITLTEGKNTITVTGYKGEIPTKQAVIVYFTTEQF
jgi:hypothetical protein